MAVEDVDVGSPQEASRPLVSPVVEVLDRTARVEEEERLPEQ